MAKVDAAVAAAASSGEEQPGAVSVRNARRMLEHLAAEGRSGGAHISGNISGTGYVNDCRDFYSVAVLSQRGMMAL